MYAIYYIGVCETISERSKLLCPQLAINVLIQWLQARLAANIILTRIVLDKDKYEHSGYNRGSVKDAAKDHHALDITLVKYVMKSSINVISKPKQRAA